MILHEQLEELFREVFGDDRLVLTDETVAADIPAWDSFSHINLMFAIEQRFGFQFAGNELAEFKNVGELKEYIRRRWNG